jgi:hypothetical protein
VLHAARSLPKWQESRSCGQQLLRSVLATFDRVGAHEPYSFHVRYKTHQDQAKARFNHPSTKQYGLHNSVVYYACLISAGRHRVHSGVTTAT